MPNIIVVDKEDESRALLESYCQQLEINNIVFAGFSEFDKWFLTHDDYCIDIILVSIDADDETGFIESARIRNKLKSKITASIVFLLSEHNDSHYIRSLKYGDGYLLKPFSSDLLISSIHYHLKRRELNRMLAQKNDKLLEYQKAVKQEHDLVESIFANHYERHLIDSDYIRFYISPASIFNGDVLLTAKGPSGSLYLAVGDVTGHGLAAAIGAMPVYSTFRNMAKKGKSIGNIADEMNTSLRNLLPDNMMMAFVIMELDYSRGEASIWAGGMPEVIIADNKGEIVRKIVSRHAPLSVLEPGKFRQDVDVIKLQDGDRLYFYTDGIEEANNKDGEMFGTERFQSLFSGEPDKIFNRIIEANNHFIDTNGQDDDITLIEVLYCDENDFEKTLEKKEPSTIPSVPWSMNFPLTVREFKRADPIAQIIRFMDNSIDLDAHQDCISTIMSELYNNALEHGLLQLDADIKQAEDGFVDYYIARKQKLSTLEEGKINIHIEYEPLEDDVIGLLTISITDTGNGFDLDEIQSSVDNELRSYGHGINLVKNLCSSVEYRHGGRTVIAKYYINY